MNVFDSITIEFDIEHRTFRQVPFGALPARQEKSKIYWIHCNLNKLKDFQSIAKKLRLPNQIVKLCSEEKLTSNMIDTDDSLTLAIENLTSTEINSEYEVQFGNIFIYLTKHYCFTASAHPNPVLFDFLANCDIAINYAKTPCFVLFLVLEGIINDYARVLLNYEDVTDELDFIIRKTNQNIYGQVMEVKHQVMKMKRNMIAIREILMRITGRNIQVISEQCRASLYNLSNHSHLTVNEIDSIRDVLNGLLGQIDNDLMQKMSETMKVLTAFAAIFLPLTLITGIYGMNFEWIPELKWKYGYFGALTLLVVCALGLIYFFKKKKWF